MRRCPGAGATRELRASMLPPALFGSLQPFGQGAKEERLGCYAGRRIRREGIDMPEQNKAQWKRVGYLGYLGGSETRVVRAVPTPSAAQRA